MKQFKEKAAKKEEELSQTEDSLGSPGNEEKEKRSRMDELLAEAQNQAALKRDLEEQLKQVLAPNKTQEHQLQAMKRQQTGAERLMCLSLTYVVA
jgi:ribosomal protein S4